MMGKTVLLKLHYHLSSSKLRQGADMTGPQPADLPVGGWEQGQLSEGASARGALATACKTVQHRGGRTATLRNYVTGQHAISCAESPPISSAGQQHGNTSVGRKVRNFEKLGIFGTDPRQ